MASNAGLSAATRLMPDQRQRQRQRQRHGAAKNLAEGVGGLIVGTALVLLVRELMRGRKAGRTPEAARATASLPPPDARP